MRSFPVPLGFFSLLLVAGCALPEATVGPADCPSPCERLVDGREERAFEPHIALRPGDPDHILIGSTLYRGEGDLGAPLSLTRHVSFDGGATFDNADFPGDVPAASPLALYTQWADPNVAMLEDGSAVFVGMGGTGVREEGAAVPVVGWTSFDVFAARSTDGGLTWPEATVLGEGSSVMSVTPSTGEYHDQPFVVAGRGEHARTVFVAWIRVVHTPVESHSIYAALSSDGGATWGEPTLVKEGGAFRSPRPAIAEDGALYIAMRDYVADEDQRPVHLARSTDGGATWTTERVHDLVSAVWTPLAAHGGALYMATAQADEDRKQTVMLHTSHDRGATWSAVPLDTPEAPGLTTPAITTDGEGAVWVSFLHPLAAGGHTLLVARVAQDGAVDVTVGNRSAIGGNELEGFIDWPALGDYMGIAGAPRGAVATWISGEGSDRDLQITWVGR